MKKLLTILFSFVFVLALCVPAFAAAPADDLAGDDTIITDESTLVGVEVYALSPVTSNNTTGLKAVLLEFLGSYDAIVVEYEYQNNNNNYSSYLREVQPDYVWLCSAALLVVMIFCLFKLGGSLLCRR